MWDSTKAFTNVNVTHGFQIFCVEPDNTLHYLPINLLADNNFFMCLLKVEALTAFGNIVLDFNPHKIVVMQFGGFIQLVNLAQSMEPALRRNAVLALKNLLYMADITVKRRVMSELSVSTLCDLIRGESQFQWATSVFFKVVSPICAILINSSKLEKTPLCSIYMKIF
jgi:hypothetical protein